MHAMNCPLNSDEVIQDISHQLNSNIVFVGIIGFKEQWLWLHANACLPIS